MRTEIIACVGAVLLFPACSSTPPLDCLRVVQVEPAAVTLPARIDATFRVETCSGEPPSTDLTFSLSDDGEPISAFEAAEGTVGRPREFRSFVLLLLDMSGSIVESGALDELRAEALNFVIGPNGVLSCAADAESTVVGIYAFDGRDTLQEVTPFTNDTAAITVAIEGLSCDGTRFCVDDTTNLYGAVAQASRTLSAARAAATDVQFTAGALVTFTDGDDQASRSTLEEALDTVRAADLEIPASDRPSLVMTIGLGGRDQPDGVERAGARWIRVR